MKNGPMGRRIPSSQSLSVRLECRKWFSRVTTYTGLMVGVPPATSYASVTKLPVDVDEFAVARGLVGEPIPTIRCKTVDLYVPADAEIVFEGIIPSDSLELEGPFGESNGHVYPKSYSMVMDVKCISHRKDAIWTSFLSQAEKRLSFLGELKKRGEEFVRKAGRTEQGLHIWED
jgi:UbiD family decarboxylase